MARGGYLVPCVTFPVEQCRSELIYGHHDFTVSEPQNFCSFARVPDYAEQKDPQGPCHLGSHSAICIPSQCAVARRLQRGLCRELLSEQNLKALPRSAISFVSTIASAVSATNPGSHLGEPLLVGESLQGTTLGIPVESSTSRLPA